jgi:hypothetical protein
VGADIVKASGRALHYFAITARVHRRRVDPNNPGLDCLRGIGTLRVPSQARAIVVHSPNAVLLVTGCCRKRRIAALFRFQEDN